MFALRLILLCLGLAATPIAAGTPQPLHPVIAILPKGQVNKPYPLTSLVAGGTPPYAGQQIAGALPQGMSISSTGTLVGTPREAGSFKFQVAFADSGGGTLQLSYSLQIVR